MEKKEILILGAGIAGLVAARQIRRAGLDTALIEGRNRTGGRILSIPQHGTTIEAGPEFIHGQLKGTRSLLKEFSIPFISTGGKAYRARNGNLTEETGETKGWDLLIKEMKAIKTDLPLMQFLQERFSGEEYRELRNAAIRFAEGFDLADVHRASTVSLAREWAEESSGQYRIPGGYGQLTDALAHEFISSGGEIFLNNPVGEIQWTKHAVCVTATNNRKWAAKKLLVTLPTGTLTRREGEAYAIRFTPEIPEKRAALERIGFGTVVKIVLQWRVSFWEPMIPDAQFIFSEEDVPTWWARPQVLVGWVGGPAAESISGLADNDLLQLALKSLASIFGTGLAELKANLLEAGIFNWEKDLFTQGAYSYTLAGSEGVAEILRRPLEETLYFAGEACYEGPHGGTVEAAIISGMEAAKELLRSY